MSDARDNGKGVLPGQRQGPRHAARLGRAGRLARRSLAAWPVVPVIMAAAGGVPAQAGVQGAGVQGAARRPSVIVCAGYASCRSRGHSSHGYGTHSGSSYWRMTAGDECTNYVAYIESRVFRARAPRYLLGNAGQWPATARAHGVVVNHRPSVGAVAEWDGGAPGMGPGHVAVVEKVGRHRRYIVISQQAIGSEPDGYDWTRINAGFPARDWQEWPDHFIHFRHRHSRHR